MVKRHREAKATRRKRHKMEKGKILPGLALTLDLIIKLKEWKVCQRKNKWYILHWSAGS